MPLLEDFLFNNIPLAVLSSSPKSGISGIGTNQDITLSTISTITSIISLIKSAASSKGFQPHFYFNLQLAPIFSKPNFSKSLSASNFEVIESNIGLLSDTCLTLSNN